MRFFRIIWVLLGLLLVACKKQQEPLPPSPFVDAAREQIGQTLAYDPAYVGLSYPGGDVPIEKGVCTDVVIRALRKAHGYDLQKRVHEDMNGHFSDYPKNWSLTKPDKNIDHRRVPNLQVYFSRKETELEISENPDDYRPGDLVTCKVSSGRPHIMIVSDQRDEGGLPMIIHNIGAGTKEESGLFAFEITGHYRVARSEGESSPGFESEK